MNMDEAKIKHIKKVAKTNDEKIKQLNEILKVLDNIRTGHVNTYDEENMDNNYSMWYSEKNLCLMEELLKMDFNHHILYALVYISLKHKGVFNSKNRVYNDEVLGVVYECTYDLISILDLWRYCTPAVLEDLCIR